MRAYLVGRRSQLHSSHDIRQEIQVLVCEVQRRRERPGVSCPEKVYLAG